MEENRKEKFLAARGAIPKSILSKAQMFELCNILVAEGEISDATMIEITKFVWRQKKIIKPENDQSFWNGGAKPITLFSQIAIARNFETRLPTSSEIFSKITNNAI